MDRGAWWATVCGVTKNQTPVKNVGFFGCGKRLGMLEGKF